MPRPHTFKACLALTLLAAPLICGAASVNAQNLSLESVRVRLPNGQVISVDDGNNWVQDSRVVTYKRYYYEPRERVYVVYNGNSNYYHHHRVHDIRRDDRRDDRHDDRRDDNRNNRFCPPGHAKKGEC